MAGWRPAVIVEGTVYDPVHSVLPLPSTESYVKATLSPFGISTCTWLSTDAAEFLFIIEEVAVRLTVLPVERVLESKERETVHVGKMRMRLLFPSLTIS